MPKKTLSIVFQSEPLAMSGRTGLGASGGGVTNWKSSVTSPREILPLADSASCTA